ncbi:hypothetical protein CC86DRAFT_410632 [Ophiobolus disseminans]|uniref:Uncharacterized protein n=1 Tax=Ophiobolus disseminans TaxID=1469910 RepID=A0A6A6ZNM1_9PLEO|nr:hypothetical protein CC86DRAFT_410632 [Ophiobolus disseminans]
MKFKRNRKSPISCISFEAGFMIFLVLVVLGVIGGLAYNYRDLSPSTKDLMSVRMGNDQDQPSTPEDGAPLDRHTIFGKPEDVKTAECTLCKNTMKACLGRCVKRLGYFGRCEGEIIKMYPFCYTECDLNSFPHYMPPIGWNNVTGGI